MKLYEYEGKELFKKIGIPVPRGIMVTSAAAAGEAAAQLGTEVVIKSQILQGGRGKAGGIKFAATTGEAREAAAAILGSQLKAETVSKLLVEEKLAIARELYLAITIDAVKASPLIMASAAGGMDIEEVARETPERIVREAVPIFRGLLPFQARRVAYRLGLAGKEASAFTDILLKLYRVFRFYDAELVEINPLVVTDDGKMVAADAKVNIYDGALFRQIDFVKGPERYDNEREYRAARYGLGYVKLEGNIGVLCTGAGLTMTVLDLINYYGGKPANFLEFGGATYKNSYYAMQLVLEDPDVKVILINTFGLVARADVISQGLAQAIKELKPTQPIIASIRGTGEEEAREILRKEVGLEPYANVEEAVRAAVKLAGG
ncbi:ADP-forming succinate--CoA ligase subunit beta [Neomoorella mulderi]|uniref:Succinate--CoA ligase [ADP-forming] subunit beta n=1 Tax=Moorella mulderi DSM 14980 TaxID=1122241 RepID=A0A151B0Y2_9FIRM|nr:ADP-forming succinate--CoA ligase subunit beta [Moorella mulderi]KYH33480.1 succinyl-CoA ligase [ADP-forming] subunit beta [Moorella mulderi DSM 14980]